MMSSRNANDMFEPFNISYSNLSNNTTPEKSHQLLCLENELLNDQTNPPQSITVHCIYCHNGFPEFIKDALQV